MKREVHYIRQWSGEARDETPLCGVPSEGTRRTAHPGDVILNSADVCKDCRSLYKAMRQRYGKDWRKA